MSVELNDAKTLLDRAANLLVRLSEDEDSTREVRDENGVQASKLIEEINLFLDGPEDEDEDEDLDDDSWVEYDDDYDDEDEDDDDYYDTDLEDDYDDEDEDEDENNIAR